MYVSARSLSGFGLIPLPGLKLTPIKVSAFTSPSRGVTVPTDPATIPLSYEMYPTSVRYPMPLESQPCVQCRAWNPARSPRYDPCASLCVKSKTP